MAHEIWQSMLCVVTVWFTARTLGTLCVRLSQPRVVGEILAGILLGPTGIGTSASSSLFNDDATLVIKGLATLALVLYMLIVGLDFDSREIAGPTVRKVLGLGIAAVVLPTLLALPVAVVLPVDDFRGVGVGYAPFFFSLAAALSVSALPVTALILDERGLTASAAGRICIGAAALVTVLQFVLLAVAESLASPSQEPWLLPLKMVALVALAGACRSIRFLWESAERRWRSSQASSASAAEEEVEVEAPPDLRIAAFALAVLCAIATERCGFTFLLGPFLFGVFAVPHRSALRASLKTPLFRVTTWLLLPLFFAVSGLSTDLRTLEGAQIPGILLVMAAGVASKMGVAVVGKLALSMSWKEAGLLASLLNCRGLLVLVVNLRADDLGIIGPAMFTSNVLMAIVSTLMVGPLVNKFSGQGGGEEKEKEEVEAQCGGGGLSLSKTTHNTAQEV